MKKKTLLTTVLASALLFSAIVGTMLVQLGKANPIMHYWVNKGDVAPDQNTEPPSILVVSPESNTVYGVNAISLSLNVSIGNSSTASSRVLEEICYETDWQPSNTSIYQYFWNSSAHPYVPLKIPEFFEPIEWHNLVYPTPPPRKTEFSGTINLTGIPDGDHTIKVYAVESGEYSLYVIQGPTGDSRDFAHYYSSFNITGCSLVRFTVDTTPPEVSILSLENKTYFSPEIQLDYTVSEESLTLYSLDGLKNETISGNATLTNLPYGEHNVTVYATDIAGNTGVSETVYFTVEEPPKPFLTTMVIAPAASVAVLSVGLAAYFRKRKNGVDRKHE